MLIKVLIDLPERVQPGDFVMRVSSDVTDEGAAQTLRHALERSGLATGPTTRHCQSNSPVSMWRASSVQGAAVFKAVRGEYGSGKTFFGRWLQERKP